MGLAHKWTGTRWDWDWYTMGLGLWHKWTGTRRDWDWYTMGLGHKWTDTLQDWTYIYIHTHTHTTPYTHIYVSKAGTTSQSVTCVYVCAPLSHNQHRPLHHHHHHIQPCWLVGRPGDEREGQLRAIWNGTESAVVLIKHNAKAAISHQGFCV